MKQQLHHLCMASAGRLMQRGRAPGRHLADVVHIGTVLQQLRGARQAGGGQAGSVEGESVHCNAALQKVG